MAGEPPSRRVEGYLDDVHPDWVRGWAWRPEAPQEVVAVELLAASGEVVARTEARLHRADLDAAGKRDGRCAFELTLPEGGGGPFVLWAGREGGGEDGGLVLASAIEARPRLAVTPGPQGLAGASGVKGWLDQADADEIRGWCHAAEPFAAPVVLELVEDERGAGHHGGRPVAHPT